jgi:hypothetical protein
VDSADARYLTRSSVVKSCLDLELVAQGGPFAGLRVLRTTVTRYNQRHFRTNTLKTLVT